MSHKLSRDGHRQTWMETPSLSQAYAAASQAFIQRQHQTSLQHAARGIALLNTEPRGWWLTEEQASQDEQYRSKLSVLLSTVLATAWSAGDSDVVLSDLAHAPVLFRLSAVNKKTSLSKSFEALKATQLSLFGTQQELSAVPPAAVVALSLAGAKLSLASQGCSIVQDWCDTLPQIARTMLFNSIQPLSNNGEPDHCMDESISGLTESRMLSPEQGPEGIQSKHGQAFRKLLRVYCLTLVPKGGNGPDAEHFLDSLASGTTPCINATLSDVGCTLISQQI